MIFDKDEKAIWNTFISIYHEELNRSLTKSNKKGSLQQSFQLRTILGQSDNLQAI